MNKEELEFLCISHPLAEAYLDDDESFLNTLKFEFRHQKTSTFTSAALLKETLANQIEPIEQVLHFSSMEAADSITEYQIRFNIFDLHKLIYDKNRFAFIAVVVVDYNMPEMTGIEFCKQIKKNNVYKILLTANEDKSIAIDAFNAGIIDKFIMKQVKQLFQRLEVALQQLKSRYFLDLTKTLLPNLGDEIRALANNNEFLTLFAETYKKVNAIEYYLLDKSGSYLLLDREANPTWFIIRHEKDFHTQIKMLEGFDNTQTLVNVLQQREKLLFLLSENEYKKPVTKWSEHLFECKPLPNGNCYYAIVNGKISNAIDWNKVIAYNTTLQK